MNKKILLGVLGVMILIVIAVVAFFMTRDKETANNNNQQGAETISDTLDDRDLWRSYEATIGRYIASLPASWFIDSDAARGGGAILNVSNNEAFDLNNETTVVLEILSRSSKKKTETLFDAIQRNGKRGGDFGTTEIGFTDLGYPMFRVDHAYGLPEDGPGYAIARGDEEYMYIVASSNNDAATVRDIVNRMALLEE